MRKKSEAWRKLRCGRWNKAHNWESLLEKALATPAERELIRSQVPPHRPENRLLQLNPDLLCTSSHGLGFEICTAEAEQYGFETVYQYEESICYQRYLCTQISTRCGFFASTISKPFIQRRGLSQCHSTLSPDPGSAWERQCATRRAIYPNADYALTVECPYNKINNNSHPTHGRDTSKRQSIGI